MSLELLYTNGASSKTAFPPPPNITLGNTILNNLQNIQVLGTNSNGQIISSTGSGTFNTLNVGTLNCGTGNFISLNAGTGTFTTLVNTNNLLVTGTSVFSNQIASNSTGVLITAPSATSLSMPSGRLSQKEYYITAYNNVTQSVSQNTITAVSFNTVSTNVNWTTSLSDSTKFIGPVAGYYQVNYTIYYVGNQSSNVTTQVFANASLNGVSSMSAAGGIGVTNALLPVVAGNAGTGAVGQGIQLSASTIIKMNGSTDYVGAITLTDTSASSWNIGNTGTQSASSSAIQIRYLGNW